MSSPLLFEDDIFSERACDPSRDAALEKLESEAKINPPKQAKSQGKASPSAISSRTAAETKKVEEDLPPPLFLLELLPHAIGMDARQLADILLSTKNIITVFLQKLKDREVIEMEGDEITGVDRDALASLINELELAQAGMMD